MFVLFKMSEVELDKTMQTKRPTSSPPSANVKRMKKLNEPEDTDFSKAFALSPEALQSITVKQVELVQRLVFKDVECQKLKKKFDEVDRNCRRWHDFALGLQSRVKRLALILHRQQDVIKSLQNKEAVKTDAATQTDGLESFLPLVNGIKQPWALKSPNAVKTKCESAPVSSAPVVIDLTDEETVKSTLTSVKNDIKPVNGKLLQTSGDVRLSTSISQAGRIGNIAKHEATHVNTCTAAGLGHKPVFSSPKLTQNNLRPNNLNATVPAANMDSSVLHASNRERPVNGQHPAGTVYPPLPQTPPHPTSTVKPSLPGPSQPLLKIKKSKDGIELSWNHHNAVSHAKMESYELFVYQHNPNNSTANRWKRIGNDRIKAMPLPMACTLSQFSSGSLYYFAVRGRDVYGRYGSFSAPCCSSEVQR